MQARNMGCGYRLIESQQIGLFHLISYLVLASSNSLDWASVLPEYRLEVLAQRFTKSVGLPTTAIWVVLG
jgi:hypothetical protein